MRSRLFEGIKQESGKWDGKKEALANVKPKPDLGWKREALANVRPKPDLLRGLEKMQRINPYNYKNYGDERPARI